MKMFLMILTLSLSLPVLATEDRNKEDSHFDEPADFVETYDFYEGKYQARNEYADTDDASETEDRDPHLDYPANETEDSWDSEGH